MAMTLRLVHITSLRPEVTCELVLKPDHTFVQELESAGSAAHAQGTWRRVGEGGISFSSAFLAVPGAMIEPDGTTFADMHKALGLFVTLRIRRYHVLWYGKPAPQSGTSPLGIYEGDAEGVKAMLTLHPDHSFEQEIARPGLSATARGTWATAQNGEITFSQAFLKTSGRPLDEGESATADRVGPACVTHLAGGAALGVVARVERAAVLAAPLDGELPVAAA